MTLWIGNGAVLKSSSQWQLNEFLKLNNSVHELFQAPFNPSQEQSVNLQKIYDVKKYEGCRKKSQNANEL